jgi:ketosteroid isomerase-like protein
MTDFPREEGQKALDAYLSVKAKANAGEVGWEALADLFTEDATFIDPSWGRSEGREAIRQFMHDSMQGLEGWTFPNEWTAIDGNHVIIKFLNRLPGQRPDGTYYEVPGVQLLDYAGNGKFSREEDTFNMVHIMEVVAESGWVPGPEVKSPDKVVR